MNREAPPSMGGDLVRWLEQATAMIEDRREARNIRLDLTAHYEDIRAELERDGLSSAEAHRQSLARLGEADRLSRDWPRTAGDSRAVPWTIILAGAVLQIPSLFWRPLLPLSWLILALGGAFFSKIRTVGTVLVQYWAGQIRLVPTRLLALAGVMGAPLGFEPVWAGQYLALDARLAFRMVRGMAAAGSAGRSRSGHARSAFTPGTRGRRRICGTGRRLLGWNCGRLAGCPHLDDAYRPSRPRSYRLPAGLAVAGGVLDVRVPTRSGRSAH